MPLTATFSGAGFPEERRALLISGDAHALGDFADRLAAGVDGVLPVGRKRDSDPRLSIRLAFCDSDDDERYTAAGAQVLLRFSPASAARACESLRALIGQPERGFRYLDLRKPDRAAFSLVVQNY